MPETIPHNIIRVTSKVFLSLSAEFWDGNEAMLAILTDTIMVATPIKWIVLILSLNSKYEEINKKIVFVERSAGHKPWFNKETKAYLYADACN